MRVRRTWAVLAATAAIGAAVTLTLPTIANAAGPCGADEAKPGTPIRAIPWQQKLLDPERVWPFATGAGQTVAVIDTGVDGTHPQLRGQVLPGFDLMRNAPDDNLDCVSHGTAVASLIVAQRSDDVGFHGIAPRATILPIRVSNVDPATDPNGPNQPTAAAVAAAITWAVAHGATVIEVSPAQRVDDPRLRAAVEQALDANIPVVAAVGDEHDPDYLTDPPTYPAAYDGVIGVGAVGEGFGRSGNSNIGSYVDVTAPGDGVIAATRILGHQTFTGTSIAAGIVAGTVALVRQASPTLSARDMTRRITGTADPAPGGQVAPAYGRGIVDPYRAVTERVLNQQRLPVPGISPSRVDPVAQARDSARRSTATTALIVAASATWLLILFAAVAIVMPKGRRRRWRPTRAARPANIPDETMDDPADRLFEAPRAHAESVGATDS